MWYNEHDIYDIILHNYIMNNDKIIIECIIELNNFYNDNNCLFDDGHQIDHVLNVFKHAYNAINNSQINYLDNQKLCILLASLLHDVDDDKFIKNDDDDKNKNARNILNIVMPNLTYKENIINLIIKMINLVSFSKNGNNVHNLPEWILIPRLCDRLEAIGKIGIKRCLIYSDKTNRPRYIDKDIRPKDINHLKSLIDKTRYKNYLMGTKSESAIGHFYDKILFIGDFKGQTTNKYLLNMAHSQMIPIYDFLINGDWDTDYNKL